MTVYSRFMGILAAVIVPLYFFSGCSSGPSFQEEEEFDAVIPGDYNIFQVDYSGNIELTYNLNMGSETGDVYFIFTNTNPGKKKTSPSISLAADTAEKRSADSKAALSETPPFAQRGKPEITGKNREVLTMYEPDLSRSAGTIEDLTPRLDTVGVGYPLNIDKTSSGLISVDATCRYKVTDTDNGKTLNIWVADNCWDGYAADNPGASDSKSHEVTYAMLSSLGQKFLNGVSSNTDDIYSWVTGIYGEEWGSHSYSNLISAEDAENEITILFTDIDDDDDAFVDYGGVAGFFYGAHNMKTSSISWSNERVMFFMDAVMFAYDAPGGGAWSISDPWPSETVSTLVHEFQHMIHFYQKVISGESGEYTDTWIDEMMSMATEDLLSHIMSTSFSMNLTGPRGIVGTDLSDGSPVINNGRIPWYTWYNSVSLTDFYTGSDIEEILKSYGASYCFGAYLVRNFNGAEVLKALMGNPYSDYLAIADAAGVDVETDGINSGGAYTASKARFGALLRKHAIAALISEWDTAPDEMKFNNGASGFPTALGNEFQVGSINMFNYSLDPESTVYTFNMHSIEDLGGKLPPASQTFVEAGKNLTGNQQWIIKLIDGVTMDVVVKSSSK